VQNAAKHGIRRPPAPPTPVDRSWSPGVPLQSEARALAPLNRQTTQPLKGGSVSAQVNFRFFARGVQKSAWGYGNNGFYGFKWHEWF
jgi:hypothetical protein